MRSRNSTSPLARTDHLLCVARQRGNRMTEQDWLALSGPEDLYGELAAVVQPRKLFQLGTAFLTRVRPLIRDEAVLFAIDVTRDYVAGKGDVCELLERWTAAERATGQGMWIAVHSESHASYYDWCDCRACVRQLAQIEEADVVPSAREGIRDPAWYAARAAWFALELIAEAAPRKKREKRHANERSAQWQLFRDLVGDPLAPVRPTPVTLSSHPAVGEVLAALEGEERLDSLALLALADTLEEASCRDEPLLTHLREARPHFAGCWAVERAAGRETIPLPVDDEIVWPLERYEMRW